MNYKIPGISHFSKKFQAFSRFSRHKKKFQAFSRFSRISRLVDTLRIHMEWLELIRFHIQGCSHWQNLGFSESIKMMMVMMMMKMHIL